MLNPPRIVTRNPAASARFYAAVGRTLGLLTIRTSEGLALGKAGRGVMLRATPFDGADDCPETAPALVSLEAADSTAVKAFFREAVRAGGSEIAAPSIRDAQTGRYSARVADPDGNCVECVAMQRAPRRLQLVTPAFDGGMEMAAH